MSDPAVLRSALDALREQNGALTFQQFSEANRTRCEHPQGFHHALDSWSTSDWFLAVLGELGEAANIAKKLNRVRDGIPGNKESADVLREKLRDELGDAFVYLDLLAQSVGVQIHEAAVEVFNRKSAEIGYPALLTALPLPQLVEQKEDKSDTRVDSPSLIGSSDLPQRAPEADSTSVENEEPEYTPEEVADLNADFAAWKVWRGASFQDGIDAAADYLDRNYGHEAAEFVAALNSAHWGPIRPRGGQS